MRSAVVLGRNGTAASVERTLERVAPTVDEVIVSCRAEQREAIMSALSGTDHRIAVDPVPGGGPVADIRSGCRMARGRWTLVTDCESDIGAQLVTRLFEAVEGDGAVKQRPGSRQPLAAVYDTDAVIEAAETTLGLGSGSVLDLLDRVTVRTVATASRADTEAESHSS